MAGLLRVHEWVKNLLVFAPLIFSGHLSESADARVVAVLFVAVCLASSAVYLVNDITDREWDRQHPLKRHRPIASGRVPVGVAWALAAGLTASGFALLAGAQVPAVVFVFLGAYLLLNVAYTWYLKRKVIADILAIAVGYVLRIFMGGAVIGVAVSHWLVLCTFLLATFLGFSKRRHELAVLGAQSKQHRWVLGLYSEEFLDRASMLTLGMTLTCYILYTIAPETIERFGTDALIYSSLIVMFGLFRYLFLIHIKRLGSPVEVLYYDRQIVLAVVVWVVYVVGVVYTWPVVQTSEPWAHLEKWGRSPFSTASAP